MFPDALRAQPARPTRAQDTETTADTFEIVAAQTGAKIQVWRLQLTSGAAQDIIFKSNTTAIATYYNVTSIVLEYNFHPWLETTAGEALKITTETADDVSWIVDWSTDLKTSRSGPNPI